MVKSENFHDESERGGKYIWFFHRDSDVEKSKAELVKIATKLVSDNPDVGAVVLECTNMTPYAAEIQHGIGLPVFDIYTLVQMVHQALVRQEFSGYM
jgi:Asp/Glu/hydantoin racemase